MRGPDGRDPEPLALEYTFMSSLYILIHDFFMLNFTEHGLNGRFAKVIDVLSTDAILRSMLILLKTPLLSK